MIYLLLQIPSEVPHPDNNTPINLSNPWEVIFYLVIPVVLIICYFALRKRKRKSAVEEEKSIQE